MKNIVIFASGKGSNAEKVVHHFKNHPSVKVILIVSGKTDAGALAIAVRHGIPSIVLDKTTFMETDQYVRHFVSLKTDIIVLAGFLWKIPPLLVRAFPNQIINIHPSLLPKFGGKGMYGMHVHHAVIEAGEKESGITIHYVNEAYDEGKVILQEKCRVTSQDTPESLAHKVQELEHRFYPAVIERLLL